MFQLYALVGCLPGRGEVGFAGFGPGGTIQTGLNRILIFWWAVDRAAIPAKPNLNEQGLTVIQPEHHTHFCLQYLVRPPCCTAASAGVDGEKIWILPLCGVGFTRMPSRN